jgi:hypothetical protein
VNGSGSEMTSRTADASGDSRVSGDAVAARRTVDIEP